MKKTEFFHKLDEMLQLEKGAVQGESTLDSMDWDSIATLSFMAFVDKKFSIFFTPKDLASVNSFDELYGIFAEQLTA